MRTEAEKAKRRQLRADRLAWGRCTGCGGKREDERYRMCTACREKTRVASIRAREHDGYNERARERMRALYGKRKAAGVCIYCGGVPEQGKTMCAACIARDRELRIAREKRYALAGRCIKCGRTHEGDTLTCRACLQKLEERNKKHRERKTEGRNGQS